MDTQPGDGQYERIYRRLIRRAIALTTFTVTVTVAMLVVVYILPGRVGTGPARPAGSALPAGAQAACTRRDLAMPAITAMPRPEILGAPLVVRPGPQLEQLSPPDRAPEVTATQAWAEMQHNGWRAPTAAGSIRLILGKLYSVAPGATPEFADRLVWAIYGLHQPEAPARVPGVVDDSPCYFESTMYYVDATTGRSLVAEVFPPAGTAHVTL